MNTDLLLDLLDKAPDMLCVGNPDGTFAWLSPQFETVLGWTHEELMSKPILNFVRPADRDRTSEAIARLNAGTPVLKFENRYMLSAGGHVWLEWNAVQGRDGALYAVARDITLRKSDEQHLAERSRQLEMAETLAGVGHWRVDLVKETLFWSPHVYIIHGVDPDTYTPELHTAILSYHPDDREEVAQCVAGAISDKLEYEFEARLVRPSGEIRYVISHGVPEIGHDGEVTGVFGIFRDITENRQMEELLQRSERMASVGTMAAGVVHEINNPLSYLIGNLAWVREQVAVLSRQTPSVQFTELVKMLDDALDGGDRVRKIVEGLRNFSRIADSEERSVSVLRIVEAAIGLSAHEVHPRATLVTRFESVGNVLGDENQLVQVVVNLIINAAQSIAAGDATSNTIEVDLAQVDADAVITVSDSGHGIPDDLIHRIFEPFYTTKPVGKGTGLGLSISHAIVERHHGSLEATNQPQGGARFTIRLPIIATTPATEIPAGTADDASSGPIDTALHSAEKKAHSRVLVVDDEPLIAGLLKRVLGNDFDVTTTTSGRDAITLLDTRQDFTVIVCDLMMPEVTGMDVYRYVADRYPALSGRFIFATGGTFTVDANDFLDTGGFALLRKPFDVKTLRKELLAFIDTIPN